MIRSLRLDQHPAHALRAAARIQLDRLRGEVLQLGEPLDARVAGADEHEAEVLGRAARGSSRDSAMSRQLRTWLRSAVASESDFKPDRVLGQTGDRQRPRDRAERDDQLVVVELELLAVDAARTPSVACGGVGAGDAPDHELGPAQLRAQRDDHVARVERRPGGARQQRRVEHEVGVVDERHARALRRQQALERPRGVEAAEATAGDHDLPGHADRIGCTP